MAGKTYAVSQNPRNNAVRLSWRSQESGDLYCGICMRGLVTTEIGYVCPSCQSTVERVFEVIGGGKPALQTGMQPVTAAGQSIAEPYVKAKSF